MSAETKSNSEKLLTLDDLRPGDEAIIAGYSDEAADELRLLEMGLIIGSVVRLVKYAPFGDPIQIRVRGYDLSLRRSMARDIFAKPTRSK
ncbi:MAG: ferrous iron transport protein A [Calditrichaeota bacterium]|nr:MAG: ferrous iron transport protein A [Calditrichota bacterium]